MRSGFFAACFTLFLLCGCIVSHVQHHGYPDSGKKLWESVKIGSKTSEILELLGPPVIEEKSGDNEVLWLYPSCAVYTAASGVIRSYTCDTLKLTLDTNTEQAIRVERLTTEKQRLRKPSGPHTTTTGIHDGVWRRVGNVFKKP